jgi:hypothetical protein
MFLNNIKNSLLIINIRIKMFVLIVKIDNYYQIKNFYKKNDSLISLLEAINYELFILNKHKMSFKLDLSNFNNITLQESNETNLLLNTFKYNFNKFNIVNQNNNDIYLESPNKNQLQRIEDLNNSIKNKFNKINKKLLSSSLSKNKKTIFKKKINKFQKESAKKDSSEEEKTPLNSEENEKGNDKRRKEFLDKENNSELRSKYKADLNVYKTFKKEIKSGIRKEKNIPIIYKYKFNILKEMEKTNSLYLDDSYEIFNELLVDNNENKIPQEIESEINKNLFEFDNNVSNKNYKSLDKILDEISSIDEDSDFLLNDDSSDVD